jgi:hypothetical protein
MADVHAAESYPFATLRLFADQLVPAEVTDIFGAKPVFAAAKGGDLARKGDGSWTAAKTGTWFITTENRGLGDNPEAHLAWVVQLVQERLPRLQSRLPDVRADLSLLVHSRDFDPRNLSGPLLRSAVQVGDLEIEVPGRGIDVVVTTRNVGDYASAPA